MFIRIINKIKIYYSHAFELLLNTGNVTKKGKFFSLRSAKKVLWYSILFKCIIIKVGQN
jgi:hypothetical protein